MKDDKLTIYLREFLIESKGRNAFIYEEMSKLVDMMRSYVIEKKTLGSDSSFEIETNDIKNYLPFKLNIQRNISFSVNEFDNNGNLIKVKYWFGNTMDHSVVELKKPFDIFGYYLNKKDMKSYDTLFDISSYLDQSVYAYGIRVRKLIQSTKNKGDELGRDDVKKLGDDAYDLGIEYDKPYKQTWFEDYVDDNTGQLKTIRKIQYKLPNRNKLSTGGLKF